MIGNLGSISESGDVTIKGKTVSELVESNQLSSTLRSLKQEDAKGKMTEKQILNEQLNMFSKMNFYLKSINLALGAGDNGGVFSAVGDDLNDLVYSMVGKDTDAGDRMMEQLSTMFAKGDISGITSKLESGLNNGTEKQTKENMDMFESIKKKLTSYGVSAGNYFKDGIGKDGINGRMQTKVDNHNYNNVKTYVTIDGVTSLLNNDDIKTVKNLTLKTKNEMASNNKEPATGNQF